MKPPDIIEQATESLQEISPVDLDFLGEELDRDPAMKQRYRDTVINRVQQQKDDASRRAKRRSQQRQQQKQRDRQRDRDGGLELQ